LTPKQVLDKLKWAEGKLEASTITIVHRGATGNIRKIKGSDIVSTNRSFMYVQSGREIVAIPYHRVIKIEVEGKCIWERK
jgi:uncharacterized protein (UPF0248 family)